MSLETKMRLASLKAKENEFYSVRQTHTESIIPEVIRSVMKEVRDFFSEKGFTLTYERKVLVATFHSINIQASVAGEDGMYFGADFYIDLKSEGIDREMGVILNSEKFPSYSGAKDDEKEAAFYENVILPALEGKGVSDITGEYTVFVSGKKPPLEKQKAGSVKDALDVLFKDF